MVNRGKRSARRNRRSKTKRRTARQGSRLPSSAIRNTAVVSVRAPAIRELCIYAKQFTESVSGYSARIQSIWLDSLKVFGLIALRVFLTVISSSSHQVSTASGHYTAVKSYVTSAVQSILIGAEDVLWSSPLVEREPKEVGKFTYEVPCIDYQQARMSSAIVRITSGSAYSSRAGRFVACILDISEEEISRYLPDDVKDPTKAPDVWSFQDVIQMPGAVTAPFGTPLTLTWRAKPTTYAFRFLGIGQDSIENADLTKNLVGGRPCFRLVIGYQDYASSTGAASSLYSPDEALVHVDIRGHVALKESGRRYIRSWPITTMDAEKINVVELPTGKSYTCDISEFALDDDGVVNKMQPLSLEGMAIE